MRILSLAVLACCFLSTLVQAQENIIRCFTVENEQARLQQGQKIETDAQFEAWMAQKIAEYQRMNRPEQEVYTIPVVFHILWRAEIENISTLQVMSQMDVLNEDFGRFNADTVNTPLGFRPVASNTGVQFCLAQRDPQGNPTNGIIRYNYPVGTSFSTSFINNTVKPATSWNPNDYLNVWVAPMSGGILGYAQFPTGSGLPGLTGGGAGNTDGIVLLHTSVGRPPANPFSGIYNGGRTATHEVGHYLGLRHIWGDGGCGVDDFCNDTPLSDAANYNCAVTHVSCTTVDMVQNYMDYSQDNCMNIFTLNQTDRMRVVMLNSPRRASLRSSLGCVSPIMRPDAGFFASADSICTGGSLSFADTSNNAPTTWKWYFPGAVPDSAVVQQPTAIVYNNLGDYSVTLIVGNMVGFDTLVRNNVVRVLNNSMVTSLNNLPTVCVNDSSFALSSGLPRGGAYAGPGVSGGAIFNPATAGIGQHLIQYQAAGCATFDTAFLTVVAAPVLQFSLVDSICISAQTITLSASPAGGSFSGNGVNNNGQFVPATAGSGLTTLYYTYTAPNGCSATDSQLVRVLAAPVVNFSGQENYCISVGNIQLTASPSGGIFSGPGVSVNGQMNLVTAGPGVHTVTYSFSDATGCIGVGSKIVVVTNIPVISFAPLGPICVLANNLVLNFASPQGGSYSGNGVQFGIFNPATAGVGQHTLRYTTGVSGCQATDSVVITVFVAPTAEIVRQNDSLRAARPAAAYQWFLNQQAIIGASGRSYAPLENGNYQLVVDSASCSSSRSANFNFFFTSVEVVGMQQISIYPNPSEDGRFTLALKDGQLAVRFEITDLHGRKIFSQETNSAQTNIDLSNQASGLYLLRWVDAERSGVIRLVRK